MKINEKLVLYKITTGCEDFSSKVKYPIGKKDDSQFNLINFHPKDNAASRRLSSAALLRARHSAL
jgi:hypothetical protein